MNRNAVFTGLTHGALTSQSSQMYRPMPLGPRPSREDASPLLAMTFRPQRLSTTIGSKDRDRNMAIRRSSYGGRDRATWQNYLDARTGPRLGGHLQRAPERRDQTPGSC